MYFDEQGGQTGDPDEQRESSPGKSNVSRVVLKCEIRDNGSVAQGDHHQKKMTKQKRQVRNKNRTSLK